MLRLVSYSYPPDNVPAAHRPYQLAKLLEDAGRPFRLHTRYGINSASTLDAPNSNSSAPARARNGSHGVYAVVSALLQPVIQIEKSTPWAILAIPNVWWGLICDWLRYRRRPDVWATAPGVTNLYVAGIAALLSGSRLHLDLRDAIPGVNGQRAPLLTWLVLRYASTCSVVTESLAGMASGQLTFLRPQVIYNGISDVVISHARAHIPRNSGWIRLSYAGALYGGKRPYDSAFRALQEAAKLLPPDWVGIEVTLACREEVSVIADEYQSSRFRIIARGEISKEEALQLSSESDANLIMIGSSKEHRCAIPLKVFDLLGIGRPILYHGPTDGDGYKILKAFASEAIFVLDSEHPIEPTAQKLAGWLSGQALVSTKSVMEPSAELECRKIVDLIYAACK